MAVVSIKNKLRRGNLLLNNDPANAFESIATVTVGAGGAANVEFTSIPSTYSHLQIRGIARNTSVAGGTESFQVQFNSDTGNNYAGHNLYGDGTSAAVTASASRSNMYFFDMPRSGEGSNIYGAVILDVLDYTNTNKYKTVRGLSGMDTNNNTYEYIALGSGLWRNTNAITSIKIQPSGSNFAQYSHFALYGIKG